METQYFIGDFNRQYSLQTSKQHSIGGKSFKVKNKNRLNSTNYPLGHQMTIQSSLNDIDDTSNSSPEDIIDVSNMRPQFLGPKNSKHMLSIDNLPDTES